MKRNGKAYEATGVVVSVCAGISKGLEDGVGLEELVLDPVNILLLVAGDHGNVLHNLLGGLSLSSTTLT